MDEPSISVQGVKRERDNLGWLASSATIPKRAKGIEGGEDAGSGTGLALKQQVDWSLCHGAPRL
jgi:hypothetical protein